MDNLMDSLKRCFVTESDDVHEDCLRYLSFRKRICKVRKQNSTCFSFISIKRKEPEVDFKKRSIVITVYDCDASEAIEDVLVFEQIIKDTTLYTPHQTGFYQRPTQGRPKKLRRVSKSREQSRKVLNLKEN